MGICSKLFKASVYVTKHIKNKHQDEIAKYIADQRLRTMFENYRRDRDRLTVRSFEDNDNDNNNDNKINRNKQQQQPPPPRIVQPIQYHTMNPMIMHPMNMMHSMQGHRQTAVAIPVHPERASNINMVYPTQPIRNNNNLHFGLHEMAPPQNNMNNNNFNEDPYGRKIPVHFQEDATRTRRSYKEVDIEYPDEEVMEEIDYGFGDFVKNPTKFNL